MDSPYINYWILSNTAKVGHKILHWIENMLVAFVSLRVFTLRLRDNQHRPSEKKLRYIINQAPHLEFFIIQYGRNTFHYKRVNENWIVCDEAEYPVP